MPEFATKFSILIPVYNVSTYLVDTLDAVMRQSFGNFECIIVDEFSTDATAYCINELYCSKDNRFKFHINCSGDGAKYGALNYALSQAKGKYIMPLEIGDVLTQDALQTLYDFMESHPYCDGACLKGGQFVVDPKTSTKSVSHEVKYGWSSTENLVWDSFMNSDAWNTHCYCIRSNAYNIKTPVFEFEHLSHYMFMWELLANGFELYVCDNIGVNVEIIPDDRIKGDPANDMRFQKALATYKWIYFSKMNPGVVIHSDGDRDFTAGESACVFKNTIDYFDKRLRDERGNDA